MQHDAALASSWRVTTPVLVIAAAAIAIVYFICFYPWQSGNVVSTPTVVTPVTTEMVEPAPFSAPPPAASPAQPAAPAVQATPMAAPQPAMIPKLRKKKPRRHQ